jgi:hypothetical protein
LNFGFSGSAKGEQSAAGEIAALEMRVVLRGIAHAFYHFYIDSFLFFRHSDRTSLVKVFVLANIA